MWIIDDAWLLRCIDFLWEAAANNPGSCNAMSERLLFYTILAQVPFRIIFMSAILLASSPWHQPLKLKSAGMSQVLQLSPLFSGTMSTLGAGPGVIILSILMPSNITFFLHQFMGTPDFLFLSLFCSSFLHFPISTCPVPFFCFRTLGARWLARGPVILKIFKNPNLEVLWFPKLRNQNQRVSDKIKELHRIWLGLYFGWQATWNPKNLAKPTILLYFYLESLVRNLAQSIDPQMRLQNQLLDLKFTHFELFAKEKVKIKERMWWQ